MSVFMDQTALAILKSEYETHSKCKTGTSGGYIMIVWTVSKSQDEREQDLALILKIMFYNEW